MKKIKVVIFDFDGVLVESVEIKNQAFQKVFKDKNDFFVKEIGKYCNNNPGVTRKKKFTHILNKILNESPTKEKVQRLSAQFSQLTNESIIAASEVKGASKFIKANDHYRLYIASATPQKDLKYIVEMKKWKEYFCQIYGTPLSKEDIINKIIQKEECSVSEVVLIGDTVVDQEAANKVGVLFIARARENYNKWKVQPVIKIDNLTDLDVILDYIK
jgi:HAD superfamily hydrolase (TIGR01549 family)